MGTEEADLKGTFDHAGAGLALYSLATNFATLGTAEISSTGLFVAIFDQSETAQSQCGIESIESESRPGFRIQDSMGGRIQDSDSRI